MKYFFICCLTLICLQGFAQPYIEGGKTRHRFAQLNLGLDFNYSSSNGTRTTFINSSGKTDNVALSELSQARLVIGGTHFWGHADFFIAIPVLSFRNSEFRTGVETGMKYFPWRIEHNKIRPFIGMSFREIQFKQGEGAEMIRFKFPLLAGVNFSVKNHLFELGSSYSFNNCGTYFYSKIQTEKYKTNPFLFSLGYKFVIETSLSAEKEWKSGRTKWFTDTLSALKKLNGFTLSVGPSSAFFLKPSSHNLNSIPYLDDHKVAVFPEFGLGYYFHAIDLQLNLAYRNMESEISAYGFNQVAKRKSWTFEVFKFLFDYNGFAFFAGASAGMEELSVTEISQQQNSSVSTFKGIKPGLTFGWDIRPNRLQSFYLRTNLRYFPDLNVEMPDGNRHSFDQLEFNFIQLVIFPGRIF
ncbi:MAG: hypothetical protein ACO1G9_02730 [Bacteroidota bacterium]